MGSHDLEQLSAWFVVRNAVALMLEAKLKLH
jgi:hypothetical protein